MINKLKNYISLKNYSSVSSGLISIRGWWKYYWTLKILWSLSNWLGKKNYRAAFRIDFSDEELYRFHIIKWIIIFVFSPRFKDAAGKINQPGHFCQNSDKFSKHCSDH